METSFEVLPSELIVLGKKHCADEEELREGTNLSNAWGIKGHGSSQKKKQKVKGSNGPTAPRLHSLGGTKISESDWLRRKAQQKNEGQARSNRKSGNRSDKMP